MFITGISLLSITFFNERVRSKSPTSKTIARSAFFTHSECLFSSYVSMQLFVFKKSYISGVVEQLIIFTSFPISLRW